MSYTRRFRKRISVPYHGSTTVSYPPSESGGTKSVSYSGTAYEDVEVEIEVQTNPFDNSVNDCNNHLDHLTESIVALNAAQCLSIRQNAEKVSSTIIEGFFQSVRSDIATQKMMLEQTVESRLMLLRQQEKTLLEKKDQMEKDYQRTSARYEKLFTDLNNELASRIHKLDQPVFDLVKKVGEEQQRMLGSDFIHTVVTHGSESGMAHAHLNLARVKQDSMDSLHKIYKFLENKAVSDATVRSATVEGKGDDTYMIPVGYIATESANGATQSKCVIPEKYSKDSHMESVIKEKLPKQNFTPDTPQEKERIVSYVQNEISENIKGTDSHSIRVREMINNLLSKNLK